jgi:hypothetical protein
VVWGLKALDGILSESSQAPPEARINGEMQRLGRFQCDFDYDLPSSIAALQLFDISNGEVCGQCSRKKLEVSEISAKAHVINYISVCAARGDATA